MQEPELRPVIFVASDLMLSSTVSGCCQAAGRTLLNAGSTATAIQQIEAHPEALVLMDLGLAGIDVFAIAAAMTADALQTAVAYGPHVHTQKLQAAQNAGVGRVLSRGQFSANVAELIAT